MFIYFPLFFNLLAFVTGIKAVGDGRDWNFGIRDIFRGNKLAMVYLWLIGSTCFSLIHFVALLTKSPIIMGEYQHPVWLFLHCLIGVFFASAHSFIDNIFEDEKLAHDFLGIAP